MVGHTLIEINIGFHAKMFEHLSLYEAPKCLDLLKS